MTTVLGNERDLAVRHQPKAPHATAETLRSLSGVIQLTRPVPSGNLLEEPEDEGALATSPRASD